MSGLDRAGRSELHYAAIDGDAGRVETLIREGADVNLADRDGFTPLQFAAQDGHVAIVELLLAEGAEVDAKNKHGNAALFTAVFNYRGDGSVIELLRKAGADPWLVNESGETPVGLARLIANYDTAQFFDDVPDEPPEA